MRAGGDCLGASIRTRRALRALACSSPEPREDTRWSWEVSGCSRAGGDPAGRLATALVQTSVVASMLVTSSSHAPSSSSANSEDHADGEEGSVALSPSPSITRRIFWSGHSPSRHVNTTNNVPNNCPRISPRSVSRRSVYCELECGFVSCTYAPAKFQTFMMNIWVTTDLPH